MRKFVKTILIITIFSFLCANKIKAESDNYSGGTIFKNSSECTGNYCIVGTNSNYLIIQARLYYLNVSNFENVGKTYYFVNSNAYNYLKNYSDLNVIEITAFNGYNGDNRYVNAINYLNNSYLNNEEKAKKLLNDFLNNDYKSVLIKDIDTTPSVTKGYRIMLEPALVISNISNEYNTGLYTAKGIAAENATALSSKLGIYFNQVIKIFDGNVADSNSSLFNRTEDQCKTYNNQTLADYKVKCLYKMYNVDNYISPSGSYTCYEKGVEQTGELACSNWDKNNEVAYEEKYTAKSCKTTISERKRNNIYGKTILEDIGTCRLYCKEKANISLPGNVTISRQKGLYFAWPTIEEGTNYKFNIKTTLDCTIVDDGGGVTTTSATLSRMCDPNLGLSNHPTDPDKCVSNQGYEKVCPSGWTTVGTSGNKACRLSASASCASGWATVAASGNRACRSSKSTICPSGYTATGKTGSYACSKLEYTSTRVCQAGSVDTGKGNCLLWSSTTKQCQPGAYGDVGNGTCRHAYTASCPSGYSYSDSDGYCHKTVTSQNCSDYCTSYKNVTSYGNCGGSHYIAILQNGIIVGHMTVYDYKIAHKYCGSGSFASCCQHCMSYSRSCTTSTSDSKVDAICPSGSWYQPVGWEKTPCHQDKPKQCPSGYFENNGQCLKAVYIGKTACPSGYTKSGNNCVKTVYAAKTTCPSGYGERNGEVCYKYQSKTVCPSGYNERNDATCYKYQGKNSCPLDGKSYYDTNPNSTAGVCRIISTKSNGTYTCPEGFTLDGKTCTNDCNATVKEKFKERLIKKLGDPKTSATLGVEGSTRTINDEELEIYNNSVNSYADVYQNGQLKSFKIDRSLSLKNNININRYFNKITKQVSDDFKTGYYDRGQGVISISDNAKIFSSFATIEDYQLKVKNIKNIGIDNTFDSYTNNKNYTCQYRVTDRQSCKCLEETKNAGDDVREIYANIVFGATGKKVSADTDVTYSCTELQKKYCNYDLKDKTIYCTDCNNNKKDITTCINNKLSSMTFEKAYNSCAKQECNVDKCEYCTKKCRYIDVVKENTIYSIQKCNNDTEICNFELRCLGEIETSQSYLSLLSDKLNTTNIVKSLNSGLSQTEIENAILGLDSKICGFKSNSKVVYRVIDLKDPFPSKDGTNRISGDNWNSKEIVDSVIKNGRGVTGNQIYNKTPIVTITLTPNNIKKIRKYNENHKYADNTLNCSANDAAGCISEFIHGNTEDSLKSMGILGGIQKCTSLNLSSSFSSFEACYNNNN